MTDLPVPSTMCRVELSAPGPASNLGIATAPVPLPGPGEVLIRVRAAGVNRPDVLQRQGAYPPPPGASPILGLEVAGEVHRLGEGVTGVAVGDRVCALTPGGGYAEYCTAPAPQILPIPGSLGFVEAGGVPETFFTVWANVFGHGRLQPGESLLVHGGTSGIGTTAIQIARALGSTVYATAGSAEKAKACEALGAARGIDYRGEDFVAVVKAVTGGRGVDVILDMVGGDYVERNLRALAMDGRLVQIAWLGGAKVTADFTQLMTKRLVWTGSTMRPRTIEQKGEIARGLLERVWPLLAAGTVVPVIHATFPLAEAAAAHELMESSAHIGKIVLIP